MKSSMLRMPAIIQHLQVCLMALHNAHQNIILCMRLTKVSAKTTLSILYCLHSNLHSFFEKV